ncbi:MAG: GAF domain-containing sensor histidine kinase [Dehalococcoidales bacterium]|nr:GAF domain-containing sensor histidine kinase [Dehalococcoidales bacterium]
MSQKANSTLLTIIRCTSAIIRAVNEDTLLAPVCRIITETGGYSMCWVGYPRPGRRPELEIVALAGFDDGYLDATGIPLTDSGKGSGPVSEALRTRQPCIVKDILTDPSYPVWREEAVKRGYRSSISLPLVHDKNLLGVLSIYATEPGAFPDDVAELLGGLAADLAYGITVLRTRTARDRSEEGLHVLVNRLQDKREEEYRGIARALHDDVGQQVALVSFLLNKMRTSLGEMVPEELAQIWEIIMELMYRVRDLSLSLSPAMLHDIGFLATLQWYLPDFSKKTGIQVDFMNSGLEIKLPAHIATAAYRIIQEALANVVCHASANRVEVTVTAGKKSLDILIQDNGIGFNAATIPLTGSGLPGIRERVHSLDGTFKLESAPGKGTRLVVHLLLPVCS